MLDSVPIPVEITLVPSQAALYSLEVANLSQVLASFTGPPVRIRELRGLLQRGEVHVKIKVAVPEERQNESRYGDTIHVEVADVHVPPGVTTVLAEGRNRIPVTLHRLVERHVPVHFDYSADEERLGPVQFEPVKVLVRGPQDVLDHLRAVPTQPFVISAPPEGVVVPQPITLAPVAIVCELDGRSIRATPSEVVPRVTRQPQQKTFELEIPLRFLCPANFSYRPQFMNDRAGTLQLRIVGPALEDPTPIFACVDLTRKTFEKGLQQEPIQLQLPKDFHLAADTSWNGGLHPAADR